MEPGILLGLGSAVAFGAGDFAGGFASRRAPSLLVAAGANAVGLILMLALLVGLQPAPPQARALGFGALAGAFGGMGLAALYRGLSRGSMGLVTALSGAGSIAIPVVLGVLFLGNRLGPGQWVGVAAAAAAAVLASGATLQGVNRDAVVMAGLAAIGFGLWFVFLDQGADAGEVWTLLASRASATALVGTAAFVQLRGGRGGSGEHGSTRSATRRAWPYIVLAGSMDVTGNGAFVLAAVALPVGVAAALSGLYPLMTMALARLLLRDAPPPLGLAAVGLALVGIVLISLG
jgi:drug/metabolite transporter (DMT)-like permease